MVNAFKSVTVSAVLIASLYAGMPAQAQSNSNLTLSERVERLEEGGQSGNPDLVVDLLEQVKQMQRELSQLRGQVEQQEYQINQLKQRQRDQYLDLDRRLQAAGDGAASAGVANTGNSSQADNSSGSSANASQPMDDTSGNAGSATQTRPMTDGPEVRDTPPPEADVVGLGNDPQSSTEATDPAAEREAYDRAFSLLRSGEYAEAAESFQRFIDNYPDSEFVDNAAYWLGESFYVTRNYEIARKMFTDLLDNYPDSSKVPDAMLKLGFTYYELKNWEQSRRWLEKVVEQYPDETVARLANSRLRALRLEGH